MPVGIVKNARTSRTNVAKVLLIVRGTCMLQNCTDEHLADVKKHGWFVRIIDKEYKLLPDNDPFTRRYIGLVSIRSVPTLTSV